MQAKKMVNRALIVITIVCALCIVAANFIQKKTMHDAVAVTEDIIRIIDPVIDTVGAFTGNAALIEIGQALDPIADALHKIEESSSIEALSPK